MAFELIGIGTILCIRCLTSVWQAGFDMWEKTKNCKKALLLVHLRLRRILLLLPVPNDTRPTQEQDHLLR